MFASSRWRRLAAAGVRPQRLLWASASTKDPDASDTLYVEALAAPDTAPPTHRTLSPPGLGEDRSRASTSLIAGLESRPFGRTAEQLVRVWGGELGMGEERASRARIAAGRYAAPFTDHVVQDVTIDGAPGAYARIWLCARLAFIESVTSEPSYRVAGGELSAWENEGGASLPIPTGA